MKRISLIGIALSGLLLLASAESAQAQSRYGRSWGGYSGYGSGGYYAPSYRSYGWPTNNYGWSGPYNTWSYSNPNYYYGGYPSYYTTPGYRYGSTPYYGTTYYSGPTYYSAPSMAQAPSLGNYQSFYSGPATTSVAADRARLHVVLPTPDAQLWVENEATQQQGPERWFDSPPVQAGKDYMYTVRARWTQNGRQVEAKKDVTVRAGQETTVAFNNSDVERNP